MVVYASRLWSTPFGRAYALVGGIVGAIMGFAGTTLSAPVLCAPILGFVAAPVLFLSLLFLVLGVASTLQPRSAGATVGILLLAAGACAVACAAADFAVASVLLELQRGRSPDVPVGVLAFALVATITAAILAFAAVAVRDPRRLGIAALYGAVFAGPVPCSIVALAILVHLGLPLSA